MGEDIPSRSELSRREFGRAIVATGGTAALAACLDTESENGEQSIDAPTGVTDTGELPQSQHAWNEVLDTDGDGNIRPPEHHVFLGLTLTEHPDEQKRETVETALKALEHALKWSPDGLLFTLSYTPAYFDRFDTDLTESVALAHPEPITAITAESQVTINTHDAMLHLASDNPAVLLAVEESQFGDREQINGHSPAETLDAVFTVDSRYTGFVGAGLPADRQDGLEGIPDGEPVPEEAPFFMGFRSGFRSNQATEASVTIQEGAFAGGSTQHFEWIELDLDIWFDAHNHEERVARMFSPDHADRDAVGEVGEQLGTASGAVGTTDDIYDHARKQGMIGHAQKLARGRDEDGRPPLLRRDVNTTDGDVAGLHFLSLQRNIETFRRLRKLMIGEDFHQFGLGPRDPNGIVQYLRVRNWGSYLVPPRRLRSLPAPDPSR